MREQEYQELCALDGCSGWAGTDCLRCERPLCEEHKPVRPLLKFRPNTEPEMHCLYCEKEWALVKAETLTLVQSRLDWMLKWRFAIVGFLMLSGLSTLPAHTLSMVFFWSFIALAFISFVPAQVAHHFPDHIRNASLTAAWRKYLQNFDPQKRLAVATSPKLTAGGSEEEPTS